jgi:hypothetical protein
MITHIWTVLCSQSIVNENTKNISLIEVLEQLNIVGLAPPAEQENTIPITFDVVSLWSREADNQPSRRPARVHFLSPSSALIREFEYEVDLSVYQRIRTVGRINGLPFREAGQYHFIIQLRGEREAEWQEVARIPLQIGIEQPKDPSTVH